MTQKLVTGMALVGLLIAGAGCEVGGWLAHGMAGGDPPPITVTAEYRGLDNQAVAVLVDADNSVLFRYEMAQLEVGTAISDAIAANVPGARVVDPRDVFDFQQRDIHWNTMTYGQLAERLNVTRLVVVDLIEYRSHEPGDATLWRGVISANFGVAETDGPRPSDLAYGRLVKVAYPPDRPLGVINSNEVTIRKATLDMFTRAVAGRFYEHKEQR